MKKMYKHFKLTLFILFACNYGIYAQTTPFGFTGSIATYTVPAGVYNLIISANGAAGAAGTGAGGQGAIMTGTFTAIPGHVLNILVGQEPAPATNHDAGGGGGGSFVWDVTAGNQLLIAAGGGG